MIWSSIIIGIIILDQLTKFAIVRNIAFADSIPMIEGFFYLTNWLNKGAAWGILQDARVFFIITTIMVSGVIIYLLVKSENRFLKLCLTILLGGALGNLLDRIRLGGVVDFLDFHIGSYHFPTFNVADMALVAGTFLISFYLLFIEKEKKK